MLAVVLTVLKWCGIILLWILAVALLLIACVLLVPIRYRIRAVSEGSQRLQLQASWLLHLVHVSYQWRQGEGVLAIRIFGIILPFGRREAAEEEKGKNASRIDLGRRRSKGRKFESGSGQRDQKSEPEQDQGEQKPESGQDEGSLQPESGQLGETDWKLKPEKDETDRKEEPGQGRTAKKPESESAETEKTNRKSNRIEEFYLSIREKLDTIKKMLQEMGHRLKKTAEGSEQGPVKKLGAYMSLLREDNTGELVAMVWQEVLGLFRHIRPTSVKGWLRFGTSDPCLTGELLGGIAILFAAVGEGFQVIPDFERAVLEEHLIVKGRLRLIIVVIIVLKILVSTQWRRFRGQYARVKGTVTGS